MELPKQAFLALAAIGWVDGSLQRIESVGLAAPLRVRAAAVANDIACLPEGGRPERYDFQKLAARLKERMPHLN